MTVERILINLTGFAYAVDRLEFKGAKFRWYFVFCNFPFVQSAVCRCV